jgi:hypothetical protein
LVLIPLKAVADSLVREGEGGKVTEVAGLT